MTMLNKSIILLTLLSFVFGADRLAVTTKKQGTVHLTKAETEKKETLKKGALLSDQDLVSTGKDGSALILFLDDKSQLKLKGDTEVIITGTRGNSGISKRITMEQGVVKASIATQRKGEFIIATPTSVASVKGTEFWVISTADSGDVIVSNSGSIELVNTVTGEVITVPAGVIVESTPDGEMNILETIKISGTSSSELSGGQFGMYNIQLNEGEVEPSAISGTIIVSDNTVLEGGAIMPGSRTTVRGAFDSQTGNTVATLVEVAVPMQLEATVVSAVSSGQFGVSDVSVTQGEAETPPGIVGVSDNTVVEGGEIVVGASVTVTGFHNVETGVVGAASIVVTAAPVANAIAVQGVALSAIANNQFSISEVSVLDGDIEAAAVSGVIITSTNTEFSGAAVDSGFTVVIHGSYDDSSQAIYANTVSAIILNENQAMVTVSGTAESAVANNQFTLGNITVDDGDVDAAGISGTIIVTDSTDLGDCEIAQGGPVSITGVYDGDSQAVIALTIDACEPAEEILLAFLSGTAQTGIENGQFTLDFIQVIDGDVEPADLSGIIIVPDDYVPAGCELLPGVSVTVEGVYDDSTQSIVATQVNVVEIRVEGAVVNPLTNNQFELTVSAVVSGNVDESSLTGIIKITSDTEFVPSSLYDGSGSGRIIAPNELVVEGCSLEPGTGNIIATRVSLLEAMEHELIFELQNAQGETRQLIITY